MLEALVGSGAGRDRERADRGGVGFRICIQLRLGVSRYVRCIRGSRCLCTHR